VSARRHDRVGFLSNLGHALSSTHGGQHSLLVASSHSVMNPLLRLLSLQVCLLFFRFEFFPSFINAFVCVCVLQFCSALSFRTLASAMRIGLMIKPSHFGSFGFAKMVFFLYQHSLSALIKQHLLWISFFELEISKRPLD
jgi:hypothetical protein